MAVAEVFVAETGSMLSEIENDEEKPRERLALLVARLARSRQYDRGAARSMPGAMMTPTRH